MKIDVICNGDAFDGIWCSLSICVVCIYDDYRIHIHDMVFQHGDMIHEVSRGEVFHNNAREAPCDVPVLYGIRACANDIQVFYAHHDVVMVCNDHNDDALRNVVVYAPRNVEAYAPGNVAAYAPRNVVVYALHDVEAYALHDVKDNESD